MTSSAKRLAGRLVATGVHLTERNGRDPTAKTIPGRQSRTRVLQRLQREEIAFTRLHSLQHSLWRSMELNVVLSAREHLHTPLLDLGCGNGLFLSFILPHAAAGIDLDAATLRSRPDGLYACVAVADASSGLPFPNDHFATIFANSVIEHVTPIGALVAEVARALQPGGEFVFTVPGSRFSTYLSDAFGSGDAQRMNRQMNHVHLLSPQGWTEVLSERGLEVVKERSYFTADAVFWWRLMATRLFMRLEKPLADLLWRVLAAPLIRLTRSSVQAMSEGAGLLMVARKPLTAATGAGGG